MCLVVIMRHTKGASEPRRTKPVTVDAAATKTVVATPGEAPKPCIREATRPLWTALSKWGDSCAREYSSRLGLPAMVSRKRPQAEACRAGKAAECSQRRLSDAGSPGPTPHDEAKGTWALEREENVTDAQDVAWVRAKANTFPARLQCGRLGAWESRRAHRELALCRAIASPSSQPKSPRTAAVGDPRGHPRSLLPNATRWRLKARKATWSSKMNSEPKANASCT